MKYLPLIPLLAFLFILLIVQFKDFLDRKKLYKKLAELHSCPFKFSIETVGGNEKIVFDLIEAKLYCDYKFGIRKDGTYGVSELMLLGINGTWGRGIELEIGQNIFPIILKMKEFDQWSTKQVFDVYYDYPFREYWNDLIKIKLSNLSYLEHKYNEENK